MYHDALGQAVVDGLKAEFVDESTDRLDLIDAHLNGAIVFDPDEVMRAAHTLKGQAASFGFSTVMLVSHLLESALVAMIRDGAPRPTPHTAMIRRLLEAGVDPDPDQARGIVEQLIVGPSETGTGGTVVVAAQSQTTMRIITEIAGAAGYRALPAGTEFEALAIGCRTRPVAVIASHQLSCMTATELMSAMRRVKRLQSTPVIIITSGDPAKIRDEEGIPPDAVVRLGGQFADGLTNALRTVTDANADAAEAP